MRFCGQRISRFSVSQLRDGADITGVKLRHLYGLVALEHIELAQLLLFVLGHIIESIVILNYAGTNLEQRIFFPGKDPRWF